MYINSFNIAEAKHFYTGFIRQIAYSLIIRNITLQLVCYVYNDVQHTEQRINLRKE